MTAPGELKVELKISGVFTDVTQYVRTQGGTAVTIQRGRTDEQSAPGPATCTLQFNNADGRFSPRNAAGAYFGGIGRNTEIKVSVANGSGTFGVRFWGFVSEWPVDWILAGTDVWVTSAAAGPRRRMSTAQRPFQSPYRRAMRGQTAVIDYWPMEDAAGSGSFAPAQADSALGGIAGPGVAIAADSDWLASAPLPTMGDLSQFAFTFGGYVPSASGVQVRWLQKASVASGPASLAILVFTSGAHFFELDYAPTADTWRVFMKNVASGATEYDSGTFSFGSGQGTQTRVQFTAKQNGTGIDWQVAALVAGATFGFNFGATIASSTLGSLTGVAFFNGTGMDTSIGHVSLENQQTDIYDFTAVLVGYAGETAYARANRVAAEEGLPVVSYAGSGSERMGPQSMSTMLALFDEAASVDDGISTEDVLTAELSWRARTDMYSDAAVAVIPYANLQRVTPVDDDQRLQNDVTVTRTGGSSTTRADTTSALGVPTVGDYPATYDLNLYTDAQTATQAGLRLTVGTINEPRVPVIQFDALSIGTTQLNNLVGMIEGDMLEITGAPAFSGLAATVDQRVIGWSEEIAANYWTFTVCGVPAAPFSGVTGGVFVLDSAAYGQLDVDRLG